MVYSPEIIDEVIREYRRTRNSPFKTATAVGIPVDQVWEIIEANQDKLSIFQTRFGGKGRPELEPYVAGTRQANERAWDNKDPLIAQARANYEAGTHEMVTGRDGNTLILYSIPRRKRDPRPDYFLPELN